jgi:GT2 family glycosyltransferase
MSVLKPYVVIPNWNGAADLAKCIDSLLTQSVQAKIVVVDNGSTDESLDILKSNYSEVGIVSLQKNHGFAGGVNAGIEMSMNEGADCIALFNNDATGDKNWLKNLIDCLDKNPKAGIVTSKIVSSNNKLIDSTGDIYTVWGLPFPRGRGEPISDKYDQDQTIFGASGGASIYRTTMFRQIGLFDEDFFAYYEDVDLSFRAQLAGWKVMYEPKAVAYHQISATSSKIKGFATYHTFKNLPCLMWKNVPTRLMLRVFPRFVFAYFMIWGSAILRGEVWSSSRGVLMSILLWPKKLIQRFTIQKSRKTSIAYIDSIITHDLPPNAHKLRELRKRWRNITGNKQV